MEQIAETSFPDHLETERVVGKSEGTRMLKIYNVCLSAGIFARRCKMQRLILPDKRKGPTIITLSFKSPTRSLMSYHCDDYGLLMSHFQSSNHVLPIWIHNTALVCISFSGESSIWSVNTQNSLSRKLRPIG